MLKSKDVDKLLKLPGVNGTYYGKRYRNGKFIGYGQVVTVDKKKPSAQMKSKDMVPKQIGAVETDVIEVGEIKALAKKTIPVQDTIDRLTKHRPFPMGVSAGHKDITAGTAGCLVKKDGVTCLLSNNHVLAAVNAGKVGDAIYQPGVVDGGTAACQVGTLLKYHKIQFPGCETSSTIAAILNWFCKKLGSSVEFEYKSTKARTSEMNLVDCAVCTLNPNVALPNVIDVGTISTTGHVNVGDTVVKSGRTTGTQYGQIISINYTTQVNMGNNRVATFVDQLLIGTPGFSAGGDSGSAIIKQMADQNFLVGLLFAGSGQVTIANKIDHVFDALGVEL